jgi:3-oxoacyl-[acyl-carrier-protein] synthase-3
MSKIHAAITGVGGYVPEYVLTNQELEKLVDTNDEWILTRTGIKERRIQKGEGQGTSHMAAKAVEELLAKTNTKPEEVDLILVATITPDFMFPATAVLVSEMVGAKKCVRVRYQRCLFRVLVCLIYWCTIHRIRKA